MKSSLKKLKGALHRHDVKDKREFHSFTQIDELARASKDMHDMRDCYDSLLSAAAATANSAYEFSESLREMGTCLLEKTALNNDGESGRVLLMLGKVQFELRKFVDSYRSHIFQTITTPSESLLNELLTVEEMKRQCDEKRNLCEYMRAAYKEKGKSKTSKGETFSSQQLQTAHDEYDEEATLFIFRLKSLKQGRTRSLLTQAARHHAAQLNFFRKGLRSLEAVDPHVRSVTEHQHIDYQFSGLEDDDVEDGYDDDCRDSDAHDNELNFDNGQNDYKLDVSMPMELDHVDHSVSQVPKTAELTEENLDRSYLDLQTFSPEPRRGSHSAPIFSTKKLDIAERIRQLKPSSSQKFHTYVLPTPLDAKSSKTAGSGNTVSRGRSTSLSATPNLWHLSALDTKKHEKDSRDDKLRGLNNLMAQSVLKESNINSAWKPPPLLEGFSVPQLDPYSADATKMKMYAYSGPITSTAWSGKPTLSSSGLVSSLEPPQLGRALLSRVPVSSSLPGKISPSVSPPLSSPKRSELHELPRPPIISSSTIRNAPLVGHSAPLIRTPELSYTNTVPLRTSNAASPLAASPLSLPRSFSIPSRGQRATALYVSKLLETPWNKDKVEETVSSPLTPSSLVSKKPAS